MRSSKPITVTVGDLQAGIEKRVASGAYASASEVVRAGLRALDREEAALDEMMRRKIQEAYDDPRPSVPASEVFDELERRGQEMMSAGRRREA
jgi:antitoxin ParD1/3/4